MSDIHQKHAFGRRHLVVLYICCYVCVGSASLGFGSKFDRRACADGHLLYGIAYIAVMADSFAGQGVSYEKQELFGRHSLRQLAYCAITPVVVGEFFGAESLHILQRQKFAYSVASAYVRCLVEGGMDGDYADIRADSLGDKTLLGVGRH